MTIGVRKNTASIIYVGKSADIIASSNLPTVNPTYVDTWGETYDVNAAHGLLKNAVYGTIVAGGITIVTQPVNATITAVDDDGSFTYTNVDGVLPYSDNSFTFTIEDENGTSEVATCYLNCKLAFVNKLFINTVVATDLVANSLPVPAVYANHELVYGESIPIGTGGRLDFAAIPTQFLVSGYTETLEMNPFFLEPDNRWPAGKMPWDALTLWPETVGYSTFKQGTFTPTRAVKCNGTLPPGVTWNENTRKFTYDGTVAAQDYDQQLYFSYEGKISKTFKLQLLVPKLTWPNANNTSLDTQVTAMYNANPTEPYPLVLVTAGEWFTTGPTEGTSIYTGTGYRISAFNNRDNVILIGEPGAYPILSAERDTWDDMYNGSNNSSLLNFHDFLDSLNINVKGFITRGIAQLLSHDFDTFNFQYMRMCANPDNTFHFSLNDRNNEAWTYLTHVEAIWNGAWSNVHFIYNHHKPANNFLVDGSYVRQKLRICNIKEWLPGYPGKGTGGEMIKSTGLDDKIRHAWLSQFQNPYIPDATTATGEHPINIPAFSRVVLFNVEIFVKDTQQNCVHFSQRNLNAGGLFYPVYFEAPTLTTDNYPIFPDWRDEDQEPPAWYATLGDIFHGTSNALTTNTYAKEPASINKVRGYVPAPGLLAGATIDPTGVVAITATAGYKNYIDINPSLDGGFWFRFFGNIDELPTTQTVTFTVTDINGVSAPAIATLNLDHSGASAVTTGTVTYLDTGTNPVVVNNSWDIFDINIDPLLPNDIYTPVSTSYWDTVGDVSDYTSTNQHHNRKWISYIKIQSLPTSGTPSTRAAINTKLDVSNVVPSMFSPLTARLSVPPNWKTQTHTFAANIIMNGFDDTAVPGTYLSATNPDPAISYAHIDQATLAMQAPILTEVGGVVIEGAIDDESPFIELPEFYEI